MLSLQSPQRLIPSNWLEGSDSLAPFLSVSCQSVSPSSEDLLIVCFIISLKLSGEIVFIWHVLLPDEMFYVSSLLY